MPNNLIKTIVTSECQLGEGVYYSKTYHCLFWVDILGCGLFCMDWQTKQVQRFSMPEPICWLMETDQGQLVAGFEKGIYQLERSDFSRTLLYDLSHEPQQNRLNDAKVTRNGFGFFGTMDSSEQSPSGCLYRFGHQQAPIAVDSQYTISNGPAVSLKGDYLYSTDSAKQTIYRYNLDQQGNLSNKQVFVRFTKEMGFPDGMTVDSEDHLWVAAWDGYGVYRFDPEGKQVQFISLPTPRVTSVAFVGEKFKYLAITTARVGLEPDVLAMYPHSGSLFILDMGISGVAETALIL